MDKMEHIFYSIIGKHENEDVETIINRKKQEVINAGYSLWAARIEDKCADLVRNLNKTDEVYVLCSISNNSKEPGKKRKTCIAQYYKTPKEKVKIHKDVLTTFSPNGKSQRYRRAYLVDEYIIPKKEEYDLGPYIMTLKDGKKKSFKEGFKSSYFQNRYGKYDSNCPDEYCKDISLIMKLKYPFVVDLIPKEDDE